MGLTKFRVGRLVKPYKEECGVADLTAAQVSGINADKEFFEPAKQVGQDTSKYKIVPSGYYACNLMHVGRDVVLPVALNRTTGNKIVSPAYSVFQLVASEKVHPDYLFMLFNSIERDRYFWFHTDGSVRDGMSWDDFCDCEIDLPPIDVQRKYVAIYEAMLANQRAYERGLDDLKLTCDALMNDLVQHGAKRMLGQLIERHDERNSDNLIKNVKGVSTQRVFREPTSKVDKDNLSNYKIVQPGWFSFVQTTHNEKCFAFAFNDTEEDIVVTSVNEVFSVDGDRLDPGYLSLFFNRTEFDRYARFNSWGSARETFTWVDLQEVMIPYVPITEQRYIADVYRAWVARKDINIRLKLQLKEICPVLTRGSIEEALRWPWL